MAEVADYNDNVIPELTEEEKKEFEEEVKESQAKSTLPEAVPYPLYDRVKEMKLDEHTEPEEFYDDLATKDIDFYKNMKDIPNAAAKKYYPDMCRRFIECERRIKVLEDILWKLPREDRSLEEDRFEILTELLDKAVQGFDIWDEHLERNIPFGHRLVLEARLVGLIDSKFDIITKVCGEFDKLKGDRDGVNNEREWLRYEIRHCDLKYVEIHEAFLLSYLEQPWF